MCSYYLPAASWVLTSVLFCFVFVFVFLAQHIAQQRPHQIIITLDSRRDWFNTGYTPLYGVTATALQTGHLGFLFAFRTSTLYQTLFLLALEPVTLKIYVKPGIERLGWRGGGVFWSRATWRLCGNAAQTGGESERRAPSTF